MSELYRPSNGTEGECFKGAFCEKCTKDDPDNDSFCDIIAETMAYGVDDPEYPREWVYGENGPECTAFEKREPPQ
jgi:hypothetical protein